MANTVLVTGCSSGIGKATVAEFARQGWNVAATMRNPPSNNLFADLPNVKQYRLDVTDSASILQALKSASNDFGKLDVIVNNAGYGLDGVFEAMTDEQIERQFNTNVFGLMRVTREAIKSMRKQGSGTIIQISSMGGRVTFPLYSIYHATKWAVEGFTESLQYELGPLNIRLKLIEPGIIETEFAGRSRETVRPDDTTDYDPYLQKFDDAFAKAEKQGGEKPLVVARTIVKAAGDSSKRLRYPVGKPAPTLLMLRKLPDSWFFGLLKRSLKM